MSTENLVQKEEFLRQIEAANLTRQERQALSNWWFWRAYWLSPERSDLVIPTLMNGPSDLHDALYPPFPYRNKYVWN